VVLRATAIFHDEDLAVLDVRCACRRQTVDEEQSETFELVLATSGAFERSSSGGEQFVDATSGYVTTPRNPQRIRHLSDGDRCLALIPSERLADEVGLDAAGARPIRTAPAIVASAITADRRDPLAAGETWLGVMTAAVRRDDPPPAVETNAARRRAVAAAREAIATDPGRRWTTRRVAEVAGYAPHHLSRVFAAHTGMTLAGYRDWIRIGLALDLARDGLALADVAVACGFYDHSHLTRRVKALLGAVPSRLRTPHRAQLSKPVR
jgi:AraC-like DNA-binding protein